MEIQEINRAVFPTEIISTYKIKNQTIYLTSRFNNQVLLEELIYQIALKKLQNPRNIEEGGLHKYENVV